MIPTPVLEAVGSGASVSALILEIDAPKFVGSDGGFLGVFGHFRAEKRGYPDAGTICPTPGKRATIFGSRDGEAVAA